MKVEPGGRATLTGSAPLCCLRLGLVWQGEHFILRRPGMEFQAKDSFGRKFKGKVRSGTAPPPRCSGAFLTRNSTLQGELHVSTIRMVFINNSGGDMQAFDLPMANISNEKFNQPIFGANNISGTVAAVRPTHTRLSAAAGSSNCRLISGCVAHLVGTDRQRAGRCNRAAGV